MPRPRHTRLAYQRAKQLRADMTTCEAMVWAAIRGGRCGAKFRRQVPIGHYIVDFASLDPKLVIEIDDETHTYRDETRRDTVIEDQGFAILRIWNHEVLDRWSDFTNTIVNAVSFLRDGGDPLDIKNWR